MKRNLYLFICLFAAAMFFASCEGPEGPPGEDGTAVCSECHDNSQLIVTKEVQYHASTHFTGGNFERNGSSCAPCHTSQGFLEVVETGEMATNMDVTDPAPPNCYTCHNIHDTYTSDDWNLTKTDAVNFWIAEGTYDAGSSNLCAQCHQSRVPNPLPEVGGSDVTISSPYWGVHHGPQSNIIAGIGGYEISGSTAYENSAHTSAIDEGCVTCHMAEAYGDQAGGHQMGMTYSYHGHDVVNLAGCTSCHSDESALETKIETTQTEIETLLASLADKLVTAGALSATNGTVPGTYSANVAGALMNYRLVEEDRSGGVHNYKYAKALLENSIASI